jgi:hypothetical protein
MSYGAIDVLSNTSIRVNPGNDRFRVWATRGSISRSEWSSGFNPSVVCLHVLDRRGAQLAFECAPERVAALSGELRVVLSGGAGGAGPMAPREAVIAALVAPEVERVVLGPDLGRTRLVEIERGGFVAVARELVDSLRFEGGGRLGSVVEFSTCQHC